jgi:hypothetical protein
MKYNIGDYIVVIGNSNGNNYKLNEMYKIVTVNGLTCTAQSILNNWYGNVLNTCDIKHIDQDVIIKILKKLNDDLKFLSVLYDYINKYDTFDNKSFLKWYLLKFSNNKEKLIKVMNTFLNSNIEKTYFKVH